MGINTSDCLAFGMSDRFMQMVSAEAFPSKNEYALLILNENGVLNTDVEKVNTLICPSRINVGTPLSCKQIITCGMSADSTVSFSCIEDRRALLSVARTVNGIQPGEVYVKYRKELSVYENLALQTLRLLNIR